ncbi:amidase [Brevibacterium daeguense]|uniref:Amidase n=1 Tax=Brevibacterium daeguense TaxID=909936 RepID=A0ABP8EKR5_9MICO|nr:amidase [Brevibacterium daeguense]
MTLRDLASHLGTGAQTAAAAVDTALTACATVGREYNAIVDQGLRPTAESTTLDDTARAAATAAGVRRDRGRPLSALDGVPFAIKDVIDLAGVTTTMGSRVAPEAPAASSARVVEKFEELGMVPVAKTTCHEHSYGIMGEESTHGKGVNPVRPGLLTGGSSYGSAIAVATGIVPVAIGTDTAGSVRVPAACAGITGLKPTFGLVPTEGVSPLSPSLDTVGFFTRTPTDMLTLWNELAAHVGWAPASDRGQGAVRLGVLTSELADNGGPWFDTFVRPTLQSLPGTELVAVDEEPFYFGRSAHVFAMIRGYETYQVHEPALQAGHRDFQPQVMRNLDNDASISHEDYSDALTELAELRRRAAEQLSPVDALVVPTLGTDPVEWEETTARTRDQLRLYTQLFNLLGWPALSVPVRFLDAEPAEAPSRFPASVQFVMGPGADADLVGLVARLAADPG